MPYIKFRIGIVNQSDLTIHTNTGQAPQLITPEHSSFLQYYLIESKNLQYSNNAFTLKATLYAPRDVFFVIDGTTVPLSPIFPLEEDNDKTGWLYRDGEYIEIDIHVPYTGKSTFDNFYMPSSIDYERYMRTSGAIPNDLDALASGWLENLPSHTQTIGVDVGIEKGGFEVDDSIIYTPIFDQDVGKYNANNRYLFNSSLWSTRSIIYNHLLKYDRPQYLSYEPIFNIKEELQDTHKVRKWQALLYTTKGNYPLEVSLSAGSSYESVYKLITFKAESLLRPLLENDGVSVEDITQVVFSAEIEQPDPPKVIIKILENLLNFGITSSHDEIPVGEETEVVFYPPENYEFIPSKPLGVYPYGSSSLLPYFTHCILKVTPTEAGEITISGNPNVSLRPVQIAIVLHLTGCTTPFDTEYVDIGEQVSFTITADAYTSMLEAEEEGRLYYEIGGVKTYLTPVDDETLNVSFIASGRVDVYAETVPQTVQLSLNVENAVSSYNDAWMLKGVSKPITIQANQGYSFNGSTPYYEIDEVKTYFTVSGVNAQNANATITPLEDVYIKAIAIRQRAPLHLNFNNAELWLNGEPYPHDYVEIGVSYTFEVRAIPPFVFDEPPTYIDDRGDEVSLLKISDSIYEHETGVIYNLGLTLYAVAIYIDEYDTGFNASYNPTRKEIKSIAAARYGVAGAPNEETVMDFGQYITDLVILPVQPTRTEIDVVYLGYKDTGVECYKISQAPMRISCGVVTIPNNDSVVSLTLRLPYIGDVSLEERLIGKEIELYYAIDPIKGECAAFVKYDDVSKHLGSGNCARSVSFRANDLPMLNQTSNAILDYTPTLIVESNPRFDFTIEGALYDETALIEAAILRGVEL